MPQHERIEQEIREILATESGAVALSNKLFRPGGLFSQMADGADQRRHVAESPLFQQALARLNELERKDAADFAKVAEQARARFGQGDMRIHLQGVDSA